MTSATDTNPPRGTLYIVAAPSGAGKTSLLDALLAERADAVLSISYTTRPPRPGEEDGAHYHFVDLDTFETMVQSDAFLEHAEVFGHRYGTARAPVERELHAGRDVVLEIDWQGARQVREQMPDAVGIFILPPSRAALMERLTGRGQDPPEVIAARMNEAREEISHYHEFHYLLVNDDFDQALADLNAIVQCHRLKLDAQSVRLARLLAALAKA